MPSPTPQPQPLTRHLLPLSSLIGLLGLSTGLYGLANPLAFTDTIGVPLASNTPDNEIAAALPYISFVAARNLGGGVTMLALCASGNRKGTGIFLMTTLVTSLADAWLCVRFGEEGGGKAVGHAVLGGLIACLGAGLYWT